MRVYRAGPHVMHDNILKDEPSWGTALALSSDARFVAIGGSDSKVRLLDRTTKATKVLEFTWSYEERRPMGGNADMNHPLAMRFDAGANVLVVAYAHGDIILWNVATGAVREHVQSACSSEELEAFASRFGGRGGAATYAGLAKECEVAHGAAISDDLAWVATSGSSSVRIRPMGTAKVGALFGGLAFLVDGHMAIAAGGKGPLLARVDPAEGATLVERAGVEQMHMGSRSMTGWLDVDQAAVDTEEALAEWVDRGVSYVRSLPPKSATP